MADRRSPDTCAGHSIPIRLSPAPRDEAPLFFHRGREYPTAIAWFGFKSFWGHLWKLAASVVAAEDIDSRDWMRADEPSELTHRIALELGAPPVAGTLTEALDRDLVVDFIADTGDDVSVSRAVAEMLFADYELDPQGDASEPLRLPRGDILVFGGDTAYPVANELEIHNRVIVPFNQVLKAVDNSRQRVLLGIPGNHDWYAGLDGFGRMFRAPLGEVERASVVFGQHHDGEAVGEPPTESIVRHAPIKHFFEWVEAFHVGSRVIKRSALPLIGYRPVQNASYFALHLAPGLDLWAPDRQLNDLNDRQRAYFARQHEGRHPNGIALCMADPPYAFLEPSPPGMGILEALDLNFENNNLLVLTGDTHHYCRLKLGRGMQITAGGGGAFLHPARISRAGLPVPEAEFPGPKASLRLALLAPWQIARGRAGLMIHVALLLAFLPEHLGARHGHPSALGAFLTGTVLAVALALLGGIRGRRRLEVSVLAALGGALLGAVPYALGRLAVLAWRYGIDGLWVDATAMGLSIFIGAFVVGIYFMALTLFGIATDGGFGPLAHPGYKHFVRLRVRKDGSGIDGWVIGKVDPLARNEPIVLVDRFFWRNPAGSGETRCNAGEM